MNKRIKNKVIVILKNARKRISNRDNWTTGVLARVKKGGEPVWANDAYATCWCAAGAVHATGASDAMIDYTFEELEESITIQVDEEDPIGYFNDRSKHPAVLRWFDRTIARLEASA